MEARLSAARAQARPIATFAGASGATIAILGAGLTLLFGGSAGVRAVVVSAALAFVVQVATYAIARGALARPTRPVMTAWVIGMVVRFGMLVLYGTVLLRAWRLAPTPALLSFVIFLFVSTLLEPWLLRS